MAQSIALVLLFLAALACLPFAITRLRKNLGLVQQGAQGQSRVVSALAVGPSQRVVTVEVGPQGARVWLVLGVTAQEVSCLHTVQIDRATSPQELPAQ